MEKKKLKPGEMLLFRNTMQIADGHLESFQKAISEAVEFVEEHGPQLMVQTFIDENRMVAVSYQLYRDSAAVVEHWRLSDPYINNVMKHCSVIDFKIYGEPTAEVLERMRPMLEDGRATVMPRIAGFVKSSK